MTEPARFFTMVVGVTREQMDGVDPQRVIPRIAFGAKLDLLPEPGNEYDRNAVRVVYGAKTLGYLSADLAAGLPFKLKGLVWAVRSVGTTRGGRDRSWGLNIVVVMYPKGKSAKSVVHAKANEVVQEQAQERGVEVGSGGGCLGLLICAIGVGLVVASLC